MPAETPNSVQVCHFRGSADWHNGGRLASMAGRSLARLTCPMIVERNRCAVGLVPAVRRPSWVLPTHTAPIDTAERTGAPDVGGGV